MKQPTTYIFDFDSTFIQLEGLEELANIALEGNPKREEIMQQIIDITNQAMEGDLSFSESLSRRVAMLTANRDHIEQLIEKLRDHVSPSIKRNKQFFEENKGNVYIISGGFKEFIAPIVEDFGIAKGMVLANDFIFDDDGNITGFNTENPLSQAGGKIKQLQQLNIDGDVYVIGDGYTDYEMKEAGLAKKFFVYTENIERLNVLDKSDHVVPTFDEFLFVNKLPMSLSYPKNRIKVLLLENIHEDAAKRFEEEGYQVERLKGSVEEKELCEKIKDVHILGIRSKTQVTKKVLQCAERHLAIGAFCIGTNQIELKECAERGIPVFNAPYNNSRSVVELTISHIISLLRKVPQRTMEMHKGIWNKEAKGCFEVRGKKLGIVGYGNIGAQLSVVAEALGMEVYFYDLVDRLALGNARVCTSLEQLLKKVDVLTLHVDGREGNHELIKEQELRLMKEGSYLINLSRGKVVDIDALAKVIRGEHLAGAAVDVFPHEPKKNGDGWESPLQGLPNVILTPHVGGSTEEAQQSIASFVPSKIIDFINSGNTVGSVNFPNIQLPPLQEGHRLIHIHENVPGVLAKINNTLADHKANIVGQYLKTEDNIGYVITDISKKYGKELIKDLKNIEHTIKFRVLY